MTITKILIVVFLIFLPTIAGLGLLGHIYLPETPVRASSEAVEPRKTFEDLLDAIEWVESRGDAEAVGDNGAAIGSFQIWKIYVDDVNRIIALHMKKVDFKFTYDDRWDRDESRTMVGIYTNHYCTHYAVELWELGISHNEAFARIHNGGGDGWRNDPRWFVRNRNYTLEQAEKKIANTKEFWEKVKARLEL